MSFATLLAIGCQELPRTGWPVVRGASPAYDTVVDEEADAETPVGPQEDNSADAADEPDHAPTNVARPRGFDVADPGLPDAARSPSRFISRERSPLLFDEEPNSSRAFPNSPEEPAGVGGFPSIDAGEPEFPVVESECEPYRFWDDAKAAPGVLWADTKSLFTWQNAIVLGAAGGAAIWIRDDLDQKVRQETAEHPSRWGQGSVVLRQFGEYTYQVPVLAGVYAAGLWTQDETLHEFSTSVLSAYGLSAAATLTLKGITNTQRPTDNYQNGHYGFPSFHTASTFTIAACLEEYYGWQVGVPAYVLAGLVGWSRIDQREHDLSDVLFGAVLGVVIGKTVSAAHLDRQSDLKIAPYYDLRNQATGVSVEKRY